MLKVLIIQRYYNLSGEETEFQILDCFSFQRFVGLSVGDAVPDKNTIWDFKQRLGPQGMKRLFELYSAVFWPSRAWWAKVARSWTPVSLTPPNGELAKRNARPFPGKPAAMSMKTPAG